MSCTSFDSQTFFRSVIVPQMNARGCQTEAQPLSVKADTAIQGEVLTDEEREEAIRRAGDLMEKRYGDYERTDDLCDLGDAHRAMLLMQELVRGRSAAQVRKLEIQRGLL